MKKKHPLLLRYILFIFRYFSLLFWCFGNEITSPKNATTSKELLKKKKRAHKQRNIPTAIDFNNNMC